LPSSAASRLDAAAQWQPEFALSGHGPARERCHIGLASSSASRFHARFLRLPGKFPKDTPATW
jgi:hypothetical protein